MISSRVLLLFLTMVFLISCSSTSKKEFSGIKTAKAKYTFVPGAQIHIDLEMRELWGNVDFESHINKFIKSTPKGMKITNSRSTLAMHWNPSISLSGKKYSVGRSSIFEVATVKPMSYKIEGNKITIKDSCFSYDGNKKNIFKFTLQNINNNDLKSFNNIRFYKVTSPIDESVMFNKKRWKRLSCFFTANRGIFSSTLDTSKISYGIDMPYDENSFDNSYLFTRNGLSPAPMGSNARKWKNWYKLGRGKSIINKNISYGVTENLFFIGKYIP